MNLRATPAGMWAWIAQRASGVLALGLVTYHFFNPANRHTQQLLLAFVVFHAFLGIRVVLLDFGLNSRLHKVVLVVLTGLAIGVFTAGALWNR
jgi:succinate dehydrogenase hydrophobic anchor subunit